MGCKLHAKKIKAAQASSCKFTLKMQSTQLTLANVPSLKQIPYILRNYLALSWCKDAAASVCKLAYYVPHIPFLLNVYGRKSSHTTLFSFFFALPSVLIGDIIHSTLIRDTLLFTTAMWFKTVKTNSSLWWNGLCTIDPHQYVQTGLKNSLN